MLENIFKWFVHVERRHADCIVRRIIIWRIIRSLEVVENIKKKKNYKRNY